MPSDTSQPLSFPPHQVHVCACKCNDSCFFCITFAGLFSTRYYVYICVTFSCHWNIIRLPDTHPLALASFSLARFLSTRRINRETKITKFISMANDGTENWQKTVQHKSRRRKKTLFSSFFFIASLFFFCFVYDKWWWWPGMYNVE